MNGAKKTHVIYEANLNFNIAAKYLETLKDKELITHENDLFIDSVAKVRNCIIYYKTFQTIFHFFNKSHYLYTSLIIYI
jgi:hypothetical protein